MYSFRYNAYKLRFVKKDYAIVIKEDFDLKKYKLYVAYVYCYNSYSVCTICYECNTIAGLSLIQPTLNSPICYQFNLFIRKNIYYVVDIIRLLIIDLC